LSDGLIDVNPVILAFVLFKLAAREKDFRHDSQAVGAIPYMEKEGVFFVCRQLMVKHPDYQAFAVYLIAIVVIFRQLAQCRFLPYPLRYSI
jgi:hypothetical protein